MSPKVFANLESSGEQSERNLESQLGTAAVSAGWSDKVAEPRVKQ